MNSICNYTEKVLNRIAVLGSFIVAKMKIDSKLKPEVIIFGNQDFLKVMNIYKRKLPDCRYTGCICFSQLSNKNYYWLSEAKVLVNTNYNSKQ